MTDSTRPRRRLPDVPHHAWYAAATSSEVGRAPLSRLVLGKRVVLYRTVDGRVVALEDRCVHRPVPLSGGRVEGDDIVAAYTGFRYAPDGTCVGVPTQEQVPCGARVAGVSGQQCAHPEAAGRRPPRSQPKSVNQGWPVVKRATGSSCC